MTKTQEIHTMEFVSGSTAAGNVKTGLIYPTTTKYGVYIGIISNENSRQCRPRTFDLEQFIGLADALGITASGEGTKFLKKLNKLIDEGVTFEGEGIVVRPKKVAKKAPSVKPQAAKVDSAALEALSKLDPDVLTALVALLPKDSK